MMCTLLTGQTAPMFSSKSSSNFAAELGPIKHKNKKQGKYI